ARRRAREAARVDERRRLRASGQALLRADRDADLPRIFDAAGLRHDRGGSGVNSLHLSPEIVGGVAFQNDPGMSAVPPFRGMYWTSEDERLKVIAGLFLLPGVRAPPSG